MSHSQQGAVVSHHPTLKYFAWVLLPRSNKLPAQLCCCTVNIVALLPPSFRALRGRPGREIKSSPARRFGASRHAESVLELVVQDELHSDDQAHVDESSLQPARETRRAQLLHDASDAAVRPAARVHFGEDGVAGLRCERGEHCGGGLSCQTQ